MTDFTTKHLDYLQAAIVRMAGNSFIARGWSVTLSVALVGLGVKDDRWDIALIGLIPISLFWAFDAYFLALEKRFRDLFVEAARGALAGEAATLNMNPGPMTVGLVLQCALRPVTLLSHGAIMLSALMVACILMK